MANENRFGIFFKNALENTKSWDLHVMEFNNKNVKLLQCKYYNIVFLLEAYLVATLAINHFK